jgi:hypothetical protein
MINLFVCFQVLNCNDMFNVMTGPATSAEAVIASRGDAVRPAVPEELLAAVGLSDPVGAPIGVVPAMDVDSVTVQTLESVHETGRSAHENFQRVLIYRLS